jgi:hypothetical protein
MALQSSPETVASEDSGALRAGMQFPASRPGIKTALGLLAIIVGIFVIVYLPAIRAALGL